MASERDDCIAKIIKKTEGRMSREAVEDALEDLLNKADSDPSGSRSYNEKLARAAEQMQQGFFEREAVARRNRINDVLISVDNHRFYNLAPNAKLAMEAKLVGVNTPFAGHRYGSVANQERTILEEHTGGMVTDMVNAEVDKIFASRGMERDWARELFEINKGDAGKPGITNNPQAKQIAELIHKWQKASVETLNKAGAWIKSYTGYITRTTHDPDKIRRAGRDSWVDQTLQLIDTVKTFGKDSDAKAILGETWEKFVRGDHLLYKSPVDDLNDLNKGPDVARKASAHRELHFKSSDDWLAYNEKYGQFNPTETVMNAFRNASKQTALMRGFGSEPRLQFENDMVYLKNRIRDPVELQDFNKFEQALRNRFDVVDGTANRPVNQTISNAVGTWLSIMRLGHLGFMPITLTAHAVTKASELRFQGMNLGERWGSFLSGFLPATKGSDQYKTLQLLHAGVESRIGNILSQFDAVDTPAGVMSRLENWFFKITGSTAMTTNQRADAKAIMARHYGDLYQKPYADIGEREQRIMLGFGIEKPEWDLLNKADWHVVGDQRLFTPDIAHKIPDADVAEYLKAKGQRINTATTPEGLASFVEKTKDDLALKVASYYTDRGGYAVLEVGARERAMMFQGTRPGTPLNAALKLMLQWKQFPAAIISKTWGREVYGGQGRMGAVAGLTELMVAATFTGMLANVLSNALKGQDPFASFREHPAAAVAAGFIRAGGGSIYGDFLLGEWNRFGHSLVSSLAGPTFSQLDKVAEIWSDITHGASKTHGFRDAANLGVKVIRDNTPFLNMIYTRMAVDYLFMYRFQEWMNPGYLQRMEQRMKQKQGIDFWLKPSQVAR